jgi:hypothetical protein
VSQVDSGIGHAPPRFSFNEDVVTFLAFFPSLVKPFDTAEKILKPEDIDDEMLTWGSRTEGVLRRSKLKSNIFFSDVRYP